MVGPGAGAGGEHLVCLDLREPKSSGEPRGSAGASDNRL